jgi:hypothetical protein
LPKKRHGVTILERKKQRSQQTPANIPTSKIDTADNQNTFTIKKKVVYSEAQQAGENSRSPKFKVAGFAPRKIFSFHIKLSQTPQKRQSVVFQLSGKTLT